MAVYPEAPGITPWRLIWLGQQRQGLSLTEVLFELDIASANNQARSRQTVRGSIFNPWTAPLELGFEPATNFLG